MDPKTGDIVKVGSPEEAIRRGFLPIPVEEEKRVKKMNRRQRRAWAAKQRKKTSE